MYTGVTNLIQLKLKKYEPLIPIAVRTGAVAWMHWSPKGNGSVKINI